MAHKVNETAQLNIDGNCIVNVVHYRKNRGASYARNIGYTYSTADWVIFIDDDVLPDGCILDAYIGALRRYPEAKVFVGLTELPESMNLWTEMLRACNVMYFYGIANQRLRPPWGVTANLMVRGSRHNFEEIYPKTGGGGKISISCFNSRSGILEIRTALELMSVFQEPRQNIHGGIEAILVLWTDRWLGLGRLAVPIGVARQDLLDVSQLD
jgi:glycosyltransferase involved in cell wall biosynthesis